MAKSSLQSRARNVTATDPITTLRADLMVSAIWHTQFVQFCLRTHQHICPKLLRLRFRRRSLRRLDCAVKPSFQFGKFVLRGITSRKQNKQRACSTEGQDFVCPLRPWLLNTSGGPGSWTQNRPEQSPDLAGGQENQAFSCRSPLNELEFSLR